MSLIDDLKHIMKVLSDNNFNYCLIGGIASILLGVERTTLDIDILIELNSINQVERLHDTLKSAGYVVVLSEMINAFKKHSHFTALTPTGRIIDFKLAHTELDRSTLTRKISVSIEGVKTYLSPIEELITAKLKVLGSLKDVEDAIQLMYMYINEINWNYLKKIMGLKPLKYANNLLDTIIREFKDEKHIIDKVKNLRTLKEKIEMLINVDR